MTQRPLLITGNGLLGTKLLELCSDRGEVEVVVASRRVEAGSGYEGAELYRLDVADPEAVSDLLGWARPRWVIHTAAMTDVDGCERDPEAAWRANVGGAEAVAAACRAVGAHLVHLSTEYVFDGRAGPYGEDDPPNPISVYGHSKLASEAAVARLCPGAAIARTTVLYGRAPGARPNFVTWLVGQLQAERPVRVVDDQLGSPTLADNLAAMCLALALGEASGIYNTVGADVVDRYRFAQLAAEVFGFERSLIEPVSTASLAQPAPRPLRAGLRMDKFRRNFPAVPVLGARAGLEALRRQFEAETRLEQPE